MSSEPLRNKSGQERNSAHSLARLAESIEFDWAAKARPDQIQPSGDDWSIFLLLGGRGAGKSRAGAEIVRSWVETGRCKRIGLVGPTNADVRDVMCLGQSGIVNICPPSNRPVFEPSKRKLTWPNGAIATLYSAEESDRLRGPNHDGLWCDEICTWSNAQAVWDTAMLGLRIGEHPKAIVTTTPRPIKLLKNLLKRDGQDVRVSRATTYSNKDNLAKSFISQIIGQYEGTRLGRQELLAELLEDVQGALWTRDLIEQSRVSKAAVPSMKRIVIALDPATTVSETSDETGIIVAGLGEDGHGYVLADESGKYAPIDWARKAVSLYHRWGADRVIGETNQGGLMVETTIRTVDANISFKAVNASRGKILRAEPISSIFEQHRAHIVGSLAELEDQMATFEAGASNSPDRLDAMVFGFTELMITTGSTLGFLEFYKQQSGYADRPDLGGRFVPQIVDIGGLGQRGPSFEADPAARTVRMRAPPGINACQLYGGRDIPRIPDDRIVAMTEDEALYCRAHNGWVRV